MRQMVWDEEKKVWDEEKKVWEERDVPPEDFIAERCPWCKSLFKSPHRWLAKGELVCRECAEQFHPEWSQYDRIR